MSNEREIIRKTENMIDELKSVCSLNGIGNSPSEYKVISQIFLYKYLNDKFIHEVKMVDKKFNNDSTIKEVEEYLNKIEPKDYSLLLMRMNPNVAKIKKEYMISYLFNNQNTTHPEFYELFDSALLGISNDNIDIFSVKTGSKEKIKLFDNLSQYITESDKKNRFFKAIINKLVGFSFENAFAEKYDFFATIFEYLIKDYNKDFGKYAEYYTPNSIARIIARIVAPTSTQNVTLYDPAAGSGTLLLALAHQIGEDNCTIYSQDISQKSNEFFRLNLILNNLVHSLGNVIHGDTMVSPAHLDETGKKLKKFDYIVSNPPFNEDFSDTRDILTSDNYNDRFWAGIPNVPKVDKKSMQIYLLFLQHIINSMNEYGKAAIVVPTPFLTKSKGIENKIRKKMIDKHLLRGVISMPKNIFSNTGTNVSIIFLENNSKLNDVFFIDATSLGIKTSDNERNQKTVLQTEDQDLIVNTYINKEQKERFSISASYTDIVNNEYRLSPNTYFNHELAFKSYSQKDFFEYQNQKISSLKLYYSHELEEIVSSLFNYWFLQFEFPNKEGKPYKSCGGKFEYNKELEMEIPVGWEVKNIQKVCSIVDCLHSKKPSEKFESERYDLLQSYNIKIDGQVDVSKKYFISKLDYEKWTSRIEVRSGDFVVTNAGRAGSIGMLPDGVNCAIGRNMTAIRAEEISPYYVRQFLFSPYMRKYVASNLDEGSFFKSFNVKSIKKIMMLVPSKEVEDKYISYTKPLIEKILNGIIQMDEIEKVRKILLK